MIALSPATAQFAMHYFTLGVGGGCSFCFVLIAPYANVNFEKAT